MRSIVKTPPRLIEDGRVAEFGAFSEPFKELNLDQAEVFGSRGKIPAGLVRFRLKEWQHFGIIHPEHYIGLVIFNAKFLGVSFVYHYARDTGIRIEHAKQGPAAKAILAETTWNGECSYEARGYSIHVKNRLEDGYHQILVDVAERKQLPGIQGEFRMLEDITRYEPLVVVSPFSANRPLYTHKAACPVEGRITVGDRVIELDPQRDVCLLDEQKAFYPYHSFWKWMTFAGRSEDASIIAANLCQNNIANDEEYSENCYWVGGKIFLTGAARFGYSEADILGPWFIKTTDGLADLDFQPQGERAERIKVGPIMSDFHQPFGLFKGKLGSGRKAVKVKDLFGLCEQHITRY
ncbi:MAG: hypothetical protein A2V52_08585 [Actinobacteria bacterium RBG_19FT_COMBO_54_7]|uniref:DUF2804 domain-containing protein n=1 Tax=Candidatus Solincola sediminis TaxID=1797199 RepID=A0A1F2WK98_9ACTN|nr:MAG: hypothetical protein A2Y75_07565 [Candidatus Solincola sediminis]OFW58822.1 MAG: hypothetical protein A2W01_01755 [Candidatus Solincola sediminis]OFW66577.1 MAG: hypothetical protein A2V52_08585 [Actinobacteria bacterium RBG_19FT_COMBO_54_7]